MRKRYILLFFLFSSIFQSYSQGLQVSVYSEVSIFTLGPGDALFEKFGHNAIRFKDPVLKMDLVFNYGTFDFNAPNFYTNIATGRLEYWVSISQYERFKARYNYEKRWAKEQVLDLTHVEKQAFFDFLYDNSKPENRNYLYEPYYDNCSTKLRDITKDILKDKVEFTNINAESELSMRQILNGEVHWNSWGNFGINLVLGIKMDRTMTIDEYMYLPDYLYFAFKDAKKIENEVTKPLVKEERIVLDFEERPFKSNWYSPIVIFSILFVLIALITYKDIKSKKRSRWTDFLLFFITGLIGIFVIFFWFFTGYKTAPYNFNVLWAFTPNIVVAFVLLKKNQPKWMSLYLKAIFLFILLLLVIWIIGIQVLTFAYFPLLALLLVRYGYLNRLLSSKE